MDITQFKSYWNGYNSYQRINKLLLDENALNGINEFSKKYGLNLYEDLTNCFILQVSSIIGYFKNLSYNESQFKFFENLIYNSMNCFNKMINSLAISLTAIEMRSYAKGKADCMPVVTNRYYAPAGMSLRDAIPTDINQLSYLSNEEMEQVIFGLADDACGKINVG